MGDAVPLLYTINAVATVALTVTAPDGTITTPSTTQGGAPPAVTYTANVPATQSGTWIYRFQATGAVTDAEHFYKLTEIRTLIPTDQYRLNLGEFNDLVSVTTLKTDASGDGIFETVWTTGDYQLLTANGTPNVNAGPEAKPYTQIKAIGAQTFPCAWAWNSRADRVEITGTWGWPQVPVGVREACKLLAVESGKLLREAPFGVAGFGEFGVVRVRDNRKAMAYLAPYRRGLAAVPVA